MSRGCRCLFSADGFYSGKTKGSLDLTRTVAEVNAKYEPLLAEALQKDLGDAVQGWLVEMFARHTPK